MRRAGRVVPKVVLEEKLYGIDDELGSNAIPVHVHHLRRKLIDSGATVEIHTVRGVGLSPGRRQRMTAPDLRRLQLRLVAPLVALFVAGRPSLSVSSSGALTRPPTRWPTASSACARPILRAIARQPDGTRAAGAAAKAARRLRRPARRRRLRGPRRQRPSDRRVLAAFGSVVGRWPAATEHAAYFHLRELAGSARLLRPRHDARQRHRPGVGLGRARQGHQRAYSFDARGIRLRYRLGHSALHVAGARHRAAGDPPHASAGPRGVGDRGLDRAEHDLGPLAAGQPAQRDRAAGRGGQPRARTGSSRASPGSVNSPPTPRTSCATPLASSPAR